MRELALAGFIAVAFGIWSYYATERFGWFGYANLLFGTLALLVSAVFATSRLRGIGSASSRVVGRVCCSSSPPPRQLSAQNGWRHDPECNSIGPSKAPSSPRPQR